MAFASDGLDASVDVQSSVMHCVDRQCSKKKKDEDRQRVPVASCHVRLQGSSIVTGSLSSRRSLSSSGNSASLPLGSLQHAGPIFEGICRATAERNCTARRTTRELAVKTLKAADRGKLLRILRATRRVSRRGTIRKQRAAIEKLTRENRKMKARAATVAV